MAKIKPDKNNTIDYRSLEFIDLVEIIRKTRDKNTLDIAFQEIVSRMHVKISQISGRFRIPGSPFQDIYQESLLALRYKAVKDYDPTRGSGDGAYPFDKFALLCIRRHLSTKLKSSYQNKQRVLNESSSLSQERKGSDGDESLVMVDILPGSIKPLMTTLADREYYRNLLHKIISKLSKFEKEVFRLYVQRYSYEQISEKINNIRNGISGKKYKITINIKSVDNALSRIKHKAKKVLDKYKES